MPRAKSQPTLTALRINTGDWSRARIRLPIRSWL
jgi:hypothetical protein